MQEIVEAGRCSEDIPLRLITSEVLKEQFHMQIAKLEEWRTETAAKLIARGELIFTNITQLFDQKIEAIRMECDNAKSELHKLLAGLDHFQGNIDYTNPASTLIGSIESKGLSIETIKLTEIIKRHGHHNIADWGMKVHVAFPSEEFYDMIN